MHDNGERFLFRHFFDLLAGAGAAAEWGLVCWLAGLDLPRLFHVAAVTVLAVVNRIAARRYEREPATGALAGRTGAVVLGTAFGALVSAATVGALAAAWIATSWIAGAFSAEASMIGRFGGEPLFGPAFRGLGSAAATAAAIAVAYGYTVGYRRLAVTSLAVPMRGLRAPLRLVHLSDLHLGPLAERAALREAIERVAALDPDLVCVTGDIVDSPAADLDAWIPELARLTARGGVFAILGNHDRRVGAETVAGALARWTSWRVLRDEVLVVDVDGARLHLVGLEDRPASEAAEVLPPLLARVPQGEAVVLLAHRPSVFPIAADASVPLVLAGHTHGGQLAVPGIPHLNFARLLVGSFDRGTFTRGRTVLHVNRGLGTSGQRIRIGVPREITVVTLTPLGPRG